jgi:hypothetical protein
MTTIQILKKRKELLNQSKMSWSQKHSLKYALKAGESLIIVKELFH